MANPESKVLVTMNAVLRRRCSAIQALLAKAAVDEIDTRYKAGALLRSIAEGQSTYGERAVDRVAAALGRDRATLYRYAAVAKLWSEAEMRELSQTPNVHGEPLSWSHWMELTRAPKAWRAWMQRALDKGWPVRQLAHELDVAQAEEAVTEPEDTTRAALLEAVEDADRMNATMSSFAAVLDRLARSPLRPREAEELLGRMRVSLRGVARRTGDLLARVDRMARQNGSGDRSGRKVEMEN